MKKIYHLAIEATLGMIQGKWKLVIMCHLGNGALRTGELKKLMPKISQKVLTEQLRQLEKDHIVSRRSYNEVPPKVVYSLTKRGRSLHSILLQMSDWGADVIQEQRRRGEEIKVISENDDGFRHNCIAERQEIKINAQ